MSDGGGCSPAYGGAGSLPTSSVVVEGGWTATGGVGGEEECKTRECKKMKKESCGQFYDVGAVLVILKVGRLKVISAERSFKF